MTTVDRTSPLDAHLHRPWAESRRPMPRCCAWPGCPGEGLYRAPSSRERLREFVWLCLEHVREHNRRWDYFAGMSPAEVDRHRRADVTWHRPTWRFGVHAGSTGAEAAFIDPLEILRGRRGAERHRAPRSDPRQRLMLQRLGLETAPSLGDLKRRFKLLVKRHHPDLHGGDRAAEARLREIIEAYRYLLDNRLYA